MRTLLLGMGNPILSDDAVGVRLASDLKRWLPPVPSMDVFEDCNVGGLNLLEVLAGYERVILMAAAIVFVTLGWQWQPIRILGVSVAHHAQGPSSVHTMVTCMR